MRWLTVRVRHLPQHPCTAQEAMLQLWAHESQRVYGDRLCDAGDVAWLNSAINDRLRDTFATSWEELFTGQQACPPFASFLTSGAGAAYQPVTDMDALMVRVLTGCLLRPALPCVRANTQHPRHAAGTPGTEAEGIWA